VRLDADVQFSGEEWHGRFVDLHAFYERYVNHRVLGALRPRPTYKAFLTRVLEFWRVPNSRKAKDYVAFYADLADYLVSFWQRTHPIAPLKAILAKCDAVFDAEWDRGAVEGWQRPWTPATKRKYAQALELYADADNGDDEEKMCVEVADAEIDAALYCFACEKRFTNPNTRRGHFTSKRHKAKRGVAALEAKVSLFAELCAEAILGAVEYIEKKQTKTYEEIRAELERAEGGEGEAGAEGEALKYDSDDMDADPSILNPLQIPLDFDGKPIPYWLYKFRGLNRYFDCEICDERYRGPRAFERHFREWKHAHHMRMLNIRNTKDFHMITTRKDAEALAAKLRAAKVEKAWQPERDQEFEDDEGNVFKKSTYDQLKRQGVV